MKKKRRQKYKYRRKGDALTGKIKAEYQGATIIIETAKQLEDFKKSIKEIDYIIIKTNKGITSLKIEDLRFMD